MLAVIVFYVGYGEALFFAKIHIFCVLGKRRVEILDVLVNLDFGRG